MYATNVIRGVGLATMPLPFTGRPGTHRLERRLYMAQFPYLPLWTDAYLADTSHLSTIEHGAYLLLLMAMWRNKSTLQNDDKLLARYARLNAGQWRRIKPTILGFFDVTESEISQGRLTDEYEAVKRKSIVNTFNANARWLKEKEKVNADAPVLQCELDAIQSQSQSQSQKKKGEAAPLSKPSKGSRLGNDWALPPEFREFAFKEGMRHDEIEREAEKFKDYWVSVDGYRGVKRDWVATWRNWIRRRKDYSGTKSQQWNGYSHADKTSNLIHGLSIAALSEAPSADNGSTDRAARVGEGVGSSGKARQITDGLEP